MEIDRATRQGLLKMHTLPLSEHMSLLKRLAQLHDLFLILTPLEFQDRETYYAEIYQADTPLGVSWVDALDRRDKYFSVLEILARYMISGDPPLFKLLSKEQIEIADKKAMTGMKKLMEEFY